MNTKAVTFLAFVNMATIIGGVIAPCVVTVAVYHFVFTSGGKMIGAVITKLYFFRFVNVNWYVLMFLCIFSARQGPAALAGGAGRGLFGLFSLVHHFCLLSHSLEYDPI